MTKDLPPELIAELQKHTSFPWWNGAAYAEYRGYPARIRIMNDQFGDAVDDIYDVIEWLKETRDFAKADRLRTIAGRLARARTEHGEPTSIRQQARGWR